MVAVSTPPRIPSERRNGLSRPKVQQPTQPPRRPTDLAISKFILILLFFLLLHASGIFLFARGFLLTRLVLDARSSCTEPPVDIPSSDERNECWYPQQFQKAIIVLIDALRYDFTIPYQDSNPEWYHNALTTPYSIASKSPENAFLLKFIADPPTTTLQRLKGLTTGSLPTFIDAGSNFAGTAIDEDNLISQLRSAGRRIAFMGDDTWTSLFPDQFVENMTFPYESFNVWDLDTVDNGVLTHLFPCIEKRGEEWDVLIAHFLGVDHAGHRYGPNHEAMNEKLRQMDGVISQLVESIDEETLLVVMGDHGMDPKGDHGGDSAGEVEAALWMYSKRPAFGRLKNAPKERSVAQIDLVPTLSLLLGVPVPFNNLGGPIPEAFLREGESYKSLATATRLTTGQIRRYQEMYKESSKVDLGPQFGQQWVPAEAQWTLIQSWNEKRASSEWETMFHIYKDIQEQNLQICRRLWARFDPESMIAGIAILLGSLVALPIYLAIIRTERIPDEAPFFSHLTVRRMIKDGLFAGIPVLIRFKNILSIGGALAGASVGFTRDFIQRFRGQSNKLHLTSWDFLSTCVTLVHAGLFTSNSFTIWEDRIMHFLLVTVGTAFFITSLPSTSSKKPLKTSSGAVCSLLFILLVRIASYSQLCREEQMPYCRTTFYASESSSVSSPVVLGALVFNAIFLPVVVKAFLLRRNWYLGSAREWVGIGLPGMLALSAGWWIWDTATNNAWFGLSDNISQKWLAQFILLTALFAATVLYIFGPICMSIESVPGANLGNVQDPSGRNRLQVKILGYENALGTCYLLFVLSMYVAIAFLAKPMGAVSLGILIMQILLLLEILQVNKLSTSSIGVTTLFLLANSHYFTTGHQATLPSIQWDSAFIPFSNVVYPWSPVVVIVNTFGSHILVSLTIPLLSLWNHHPTSDEILSNTAQVTITYILQHTIVTTSSVIFAAYFRRHLMVWKIFGPRFIWAALEMLLSDVVVLVVGVVWAFWFAVINVGQISGKIERIRERVGG